MFLKTNLFKKLLEGAYKTCGLVIGATEDEYFLEGAWWKIQVFKEDLKKEEKGEIIKLTGELPEEGEIFTAGKGYGNQYEITNRKAWKADETAQKEWIVTKLIYELSHGKVRILQNIDTQKCTMVSEQIINTIEYYKDGEMVSGPFSKEDGKILYWRSRDIVSSATRKYRIRKTGRLRGQYMIYAVDFDGTLCENSFPAIGKEKWQVVEMCKSMKAKGHKLILWTCREGKGLEEAVKWCAERGIQFDAVNDALAEQKAQWPKETRKIWADAYIDDKAVSPETMAAVFIGITQYKPYKQKEEAEE